MSSYSSVSSGSVSPEITSDEEDSTMAEVERKRLIAARGQCKASFTRLQKYLSENTQFAIEDLQVRKQNLVEIYAKYKDISISLELLDEKEEDEDAEERYLTLLSILERHMKQYKPQTDVSRDHNHHAAKLPTLEIPVFDGKDVSNYKPFMEMFKAVVHNDSRLSDIQRICFLKKYVKGEPLNIIDNLPIIGKSYEAALELLQKRYNNPALLIHSHVSNLIDMPGIQRGTAQQIRDIVAKIRQHVTALKNLEQPVSEWNAILSCILMRKIDSLTVRLFHSERDTTKVVTVDELLSYLDKRAASLEASPPTSEKHQVKVKSAVSLSVMSKSESPKCLMCSQVHKLFQCPTFKAESIQKRLELVIKNNLCQLCLAFHPQKCRYKFKCSVCNSSSHNSLLHQPEDKAGAGAKSNDGKPAAPVSLHISQPLTASIVLPTAKVLVTGANNEKFIVRALLDSGSQSSFCTTSLADQLGLPLIDLHKNISTLGDVCNNSTSKGIQLQCESLKNNFHFNVTCSVINKITSNVPQRKIDLSSFIIPKHLDLADKDFHTPGEISMLLACDVFFKIIKDGKIEGGPADPILLNTQLGYIISSPGISTDNTAIAMHTVISPELDHCVSQFWEAEKVPDVYHESLPEHEYSEKVFDESVSLKNNTFEVKYPLKVELQDIDPSNSYAIALQRLYSLEKRFTKDPKYHGLYKAFIQEYLDLGHAKIIDTKNCEPRDEPRFFLPHHGVLRLDKQTNKLRVVFDASARNKNGLSLNDLMCNGPVVQNSLFDILILFRTYKYTIQCDIRHMYRMITIHPDYRCLQNILWREKGVMHVLQLQTVTYGLTSSAYLATKCLISLAMQYKDRYPLASAAIINNSYIDDIQAGCNTIEQVRQLKNELISLLNHANFRLHKWVSNSSELLHDVPQEALGSYRRDLDQDKSIVKILGIAYDAGSDAFLLNGRDVVPIKVPTKRSVLSSISRLFDPLGFVGPVTMRAKLFMQELWQYDLDWDTPLPLELETFWNSFYANLVSMPEIVNPRFVQTNIDSELEVVGYCDASAKGYGCCIYIKVKNGGECSTHLICSRSRLNGINSKLTIPKLELNGALLLAKLASHIAKLLKIQNVHLFCDSKIVLGWLDLSPVKVPAYIGNRVKEIKKYTQCSFWHFTPGVFNPADILSRGCEPMDISDNSLWRHGPNYLLECNNYSLYLANVEKPFQPVSISDTPYTQCTVTIKNDAIEPIIEKYSSLYKTVRIMAKVLRFINKCRKGSSVSSTEISVGEFRKALSSIQKIVQRHYFAEELKCIADAVPIKTSLKSLHPFVDSNGIMRVGGRLHNADVDYSKKFPIILPKHCHITKLIIRQEHFALLHAGLKLVLSSLAQRYYIINSVREVKSVIHKCTICCRHKAETAKQLMGSLPKDRVTPARVFERVGIDYCGPFEIKQSTKRNSIISKGYVAVIVCFASKAVHLEVVSDMTTDTFLAAFKRFVSRRGLPTDVYCDNASTFKGANNQLKELYKLHNNKDFQENINSFMLQKEIKFHFIPSYSPNHGGLWEAAVKSAKFHLKRISTCKVFTYEQFNTIMIEIESILNSRPLLAKSSQDLSDFSALTPGHFIIGSPLAAIPQPILTDYPVNRLRFWRCCEQVRQHFWRAWSKDYLSSLNERTKWRKVLPNLKVGDVVLLLNPNAPPLHWPLGKVTKVVCGKDGHVRVVEVQTSDKKLHTRAVSKVVLLPIE